MEGEREEKGMGRETNRELSRVGRTSSFHCLVVRVSVNISCCGLDCGSQPLDIEDRESGVTCSVPQQIDRTGCCFRVIQ